jgi:hypothetical protein
MASIIFILFAPGLMFAASASVTLLSYTSYRHGVFTPFLSSLAPHSLSHEKLIRETIMRTILGTNPIMLLFFGLVCLILLGIGMELAYLGGVFTGKDEVLANDRRIEQQASLIKPAR